MGAKRTISNEEQNRSQIYNYKIDINDNNSSLSIIYNMVNKESTILDVGCSCGYLSNILHHNKQCTCFGMEYNQESIKVAKELNVFKKIDRVDLNNFKTDDFNYKNKFDFIIIADVLEHLYDPLKVLLALKPYLKINGCFFISIPNIAHASIKANLLLNNWDYTETGLLDKTHIRFFTYKNILKLLNDSNLKIEKSKLVIRNLLGTQPINAFPELSKKIKKMIFDDPHSHVFQYIICCSESDIPTENLASFNEAKILNEIIASKKILNDNKNTSKFSFFYALYYFLKYKTSIGKSRKSNKRFYKNYLKLRGL